LNRAVAIAMRDGPEAGVRLIDGLLSQGGLESYPLAHAARADLHRRLGNKADARSSYERALAITPMGPQHRFLENRLRELDME
jgi:RNA polymerase sigma-70 factor (ECF subfamily)